MTSRIYYTDPYCRRFDAVVTKTFELDHRPAVLLDRTAFYPTSGGQPFDTGRLEIRNGPDQPARAVDVVEVVEADAHIVHVLSSPLSGGTMVRGDINWERRFDHMQQHTGQHVLSAAFDRLFDNRTLSFHMGAQTATIDLGREVSWEELTRAEDEANRVVWDDREVSIRFVSPADRQGGSLDPPLKLRKEPTREGVLRLIEVRDFDLSACGGTHVSRTGAIGTVVVAAAEKFKGGTRVTFACGGRALRVFRTLRESVASGVRALSVLPQELPAAIERMQADTKELRRTLRRFQESLAHHEAERLLRGARLVGAVGIHVIVEALDGWDASGIKTVASAITDRARAAVALFSTSSPAAVVIARSPGVASDASLVLRAIVERFGGRGGGKSDLAQGGGFSGDLGEIKEVARSLLIADPS